MNVITNKSICVSPIEEEKKEVEISVRFRPMVNSNEQLAEEVKSLTNPQVILLHFILERAIIFNCVF